MAKRRSCRSDSSPDGFCKKDAEGRCEYCKIFMKGNKQGAKSHRRDAVRADLNAAVLGVLEIDDAVAKFREFIESSDQRTAFKAFKEWLDRTAGPVVKETKTDLTVSEKKEVLDAAKKFIEDMEKE